MSTSEETMIDLDDPEFQQPSEIDPNQDIDVRVIPPEIDANGNAIDYILKLSIGENKQGQKKPYAKVTSKGNKYLALNVKTQVVAEGQPFDNAFVQFPFGNVSTMPFSGTSSAANLARVLGSPMPAKASPLDQIACISALLEAEPKVPARLLWTGYCTSCEKEVPKLQGQKNWPPKVDESGEQVGNLQVAECPECGSDVNARANVKKILPV